MGRSPCCEKVGLKKGPWTPEEDQKLMAYIEEHGHGSWRALPAKAGLQRCGKSCRLRWTNYLRPDIKRGKFSLQEEQTIIQLHALLGNRWSAIATHLPKRTDNEIKNYWNTHLKKRLAKMGIDPVTHKPKSDTFGSGQSKDAANLSHMAQWESARLEAEARLGRESNPVLSNPYQSQLALPSPSAHLLNNKAVAATAPPPPPPFPPKMPPCLDVLKAWQGAWSKPTKNATFPNTFFTSNNTNGTLESPTSTLNFAENLFNFQSIGLVANNSSLGGATNYMETSGGDIQNDWKYMVNQQTSFGEVKATMQLHDNNPYPVDANLIADALRLPNFMDNFTHDHQVLGHDNSNNMGNTSTGHSSDDFDDGSCGGDFDEENNNYWNNILNSVTLQSGSSVF